MRSRIDLMPICRHAGRVPIRLRAVFAFLGALVCAACGEKSETNRDTRAGEPTAAIAVCDLLTRDEVATALQSPVDEPQEQVIGRLTPDQAGISQCTYTATDGSNKMVSVFLRQSPARDNDPSGLRETMTSAGGSVSDVSGVGDAALWDGGTLHVFSSGRLYLTIGISGPNTGPGAQEKAKILAVAALGRIGATS